MRKERFILYIYSPSYFHDPKMILKAVEKFDDLLPECRLEFEITPTKFNRIENRDKYILEQLKTGFLSLSNNSFETQAQLYGMLKGGVKRIKSDYYSFTTIKIPAINKTLSEINNIVYSMGILMRAYYIEVGCPGYSGAIMNEHILFNDQTEADIKNGLPPVADFSSYNIIEYEYPHFFSWINYWSEEIAQRVEFNYERDKDLFYKCYQTPEKAWILQVTEKPLDVEVPEHLEKLKLAYKRFPKVGRQDLLNL